MTDGDTAASAWPADIIHVNEDGWVLVNRGRRHGVVPGLRLLVVGQSIRELRDLYANGATANAPLPLALRIRRTYEQLEVIHAEDGAAIAIATRTPPERRPQVYTGPEGELLVWVPLPSGFSWPRAGMQHDDAPLEDVSFDAEALEVDAGEVETDTNAAPVADAPPVIGEQDDERWEEALPLNGVNVGDLVLPAIPISGEREAANVPASGTSSNPFEMGRSYDWIKPGN